MKIVEDKMFTHPKFEIVEMELHQDIKDTYEEVREVLGEFAKREKKEMPIVIIGGGCLSNQYMERDFRDIDVFIQYEDWMRKYKEQIAERLQTKIKEINQGPNRYEHFDMFMMSESRMENRKAELLFCVEIDCVYDFDFRFRQFYLYENKVYVTKGAIEDIKEKKLVLESPTTPFTTFIRGRHFEKTLGFSWEEQSYRELFWFLWKMDGVHEGVMKKIKGNPKYAKGFIDELEEELSQLQEGEYICFPSVPSVFSPELEEFIVSMMETMGEKKAIREYETAKFALMYQEMKNCSLPLKKETGIYEIELEEEVVETLFSLLVEEWAEFYKMSRISYLYGNKMKQDVMSVYQEWGKLTSQNKQKEWYQSILKQEKKIVDHLLYEYEHGVYKKIKKNSVEFANILNVCMKKKVSLEKEKGFHIQFYENDFRNEKERCLLHLQNALPFHIDGKGETKAEVHENEKKKGKDAMYMLHMIIFEKIRKNEMKKSEKNGKQTFGRSRIFENNYGASNMYFEESLIF